MTVEQRLRIRATDDLRRAVCVPLYGELSRLDLP